MLPWRPCTWRAFSSFCDHHWHASTRHASQWHLRRRAEVQVDNRVAGGGAKCPCIHTRVCMCARLVVARSRQSRRTFPIHLPARWHAERRAPFSLLLKHLNRSFVHFAADRIMLSPGRSDLHWPPQSAACKTARIRPEHKI